MDWYNAKKTPPVPFVSVLVRMPGEKPFPTVHEGYMASDGTWVAYGYVREPGEVTHWTDMPEFPDDISSEEYIIPRDQWEDAARYE